LAHDFLWRAHRAAPARGEVVIFNRSYYEDVLVVRVHNLLPEDVWSSRIVMEYVEKLNMKYPKPTVDIEHIQHEYPSVTSGNPRHRFIIIYLPNHFAADCRGHISRSSRIREEMVIL
jgi:hypothetical protein